MPQPPGLPPYGPGAAGGGGATENTGTEAIGGQTAGFTPDWWPFDVLWLWAAVAVSGTLVLGGLTYCLVKRRRQKRLASALAALSADDGATAAKNPRLGLPSPRIVRPGGGFNIKRGGKEERMPLSPSAPVANARKVRKGFGATADGGSGSSGGFPMAELAPTWGDAEASTARSDDIAHSLHGAISGGLVAGYELSTSGAARPQTEEQRSRLRDRDQERVLYSQHI